ncbi:MAG: class I SAM-dependent methyltransferase [Nitrospirales bacterium]|nr:class I SAM-dependent methyltransferase [Nitrospirales bacterium]
MPQPSNQFNALAYFDKTLAAKYDRRIRLFCPSYDALHQMLVPWLASMPEHSLFLSAGAGTGAEILTLGTQFPSWRFIAVDISPDMLTACRQRLLTAGLETRVTFFNGSLQEYQPQELVDAASSVFVSHFIKDREEKLSYFRSIATNLRPGGMFILADLFGDKKTREFSTLFNTWLGSYAAHEVSTEDLKQSRTHIEKDISFIPEADLFTLLSEAGFSAPIRFYQCYLFGGWVATKEAQH